MAELVIKLFGEPKITRDGDEVELGAAMRLLAALILWRDRNSVSMKELIDSLVPDSASGAPLDTLNKHKGKLRTLLGLQLPGNLKPVECGPAIVDQAWVDVVLFDKKIKSEDSQEVREAVELRGRSPLLASGPVTEIFVKERALREKQYQEALWRLIKEDRHTRPQEAMDLIDLLLACTDLPQESEELLRRERLTLGNEIFSETLATRSSRESKTTKPFPAFRLPSPTELIGRTDDLDAIKRLLHSPGLVTLTGTAGIGKTALAKAVAHSLQEDFPYGSAFADLTTTDADHLPEQIGLSLGLKEEQGDEWRETLLTFLEDKSLLLVWDNCEHAVQACAELASDVLARCPFVRLLATSQEPLRSYGEKRYPVPLLSLPNSAVESTFEALPQQGAILLFLTRAQAVKPAFQLTEQNYGTILKICQDLDGLPLAIELAAALVDVKTVKQIADSLVGCLDVLVDGPRAGSPRHTSLQAAFNLSYSLLNPAEQELFRHLGVFVGSFSLEAAQAVSPLATASGVAKLLPQLVRKSLVVMQEQNDEMRYRLLSTMRQYAQHRLSNQGEEDEARRRHRGFYLQLAEEAEPQLRGPEQKWWLDRLETEHDNFRSALTYRADEAGLRLACALARFWWVRGYLTEGRQWLERDVEEENGLSKKVQAKTFIGAGRLAYALAEITAAEKMYMQAFSLFSETGDRWSIADTLFRLGCVAEHQDRYNEAAEKHYQSLTLFQELGDEHGMADALYGLGMVAQNQDEYASSKECLHKSLVLRRKVGDIQGVASSLTSLGRTAYYQGLVDEADKFFNESLTYRQALGNKRGIASSMSDLSGIAQARGDYEQARSLLAQSLSLHESIGDTNGRFRDLECLAGVAYDEGKFDEAEDLYQRCLVYFRVHGSELEVVMLTADLGGVARQLRKFQDAKTLLKESLVKFRQRDEKSCITKSLGELGLLAAAEAEGERAATLWSTEEVLSASIGSRRPANECARKALIMSDVRKTLGEEAFATAWAEGQAMTWEQAVAFALEEPTP